LLPEVLIAITKKVGLKYDFFENYSKWRVSSFIFTSNQQKLQRNTDQKWVKMGLTAAEESHDGLGALAGQLWGRVADMVLVQQQALQACAPAPINYRVFCRHFGKNPLSGAGKGGNKISLLISSHCTMYSIHTTIFCLLNFS